MAATDWSRGARTIVDGYDDIDHYSFSRNMNRDHSRTEPGYTSRRAAGPVRFTEQHFADTAAGAATLAWGRLRIARRTRPRSDRS